MSTLIAIAEKYWKPLVLFVLVALSLWGYGHWRYIAGLDAANLVWSGKWSKRDAQDANAKAAREASEREEEQRRRGVADEEVKNAEIELAKAHAEYLDSESAANGLRDQLDALQQRFNRSEASRLSATADARAARAEAARVLADMLKQSDKRAGIYAAEADRAYTAGSTCERVYDKVTKPAFSP